MSKFSPELRNFEAKLGLVNEKATFYNPTIAKSLTIHRGVVRNGHTGRTGECWMFNYFFVGPVKNDQTKLLQVKEFRGAWKYLPGLASLEQVAEEITSTISEFMATTEVYDASIEAKEELRSLFEDYLEMSNSNGLYELRNFLTEGIDEFAHNEGEDDD
jgi:hypothetical protein